MNRDNYLENIEIKNRRLLLKIYKKHIEKLKIKIFEATEKGNSTIYLENLRLQVEKQIAQFEKDLKQYSANAVKTSYESGVKTAVVGEVAKEVAGDYVFGTANNEAMKALAQTTYEPLSKMAQQIGRSTREYMKRDNFKDTQTVLKALGKFVDSNYLRKVGIEGVGNVVVGSETWQTAARKIRDKIISEANIKVPYYNKKGDVIRFVHAQDYAKMVSRTTTANIFREGAKDRILDTFGDDGDLVEIIGVSQFPESPCIPFQGKILSLEGQTKGYTTIAQAKAEGLFHPNCIHNFAVTDKVMKIYRGENIKEKTKEEAKDKQQENKEKTKEKQASFKNAQNLQEAKEYANRFVKNGQSTFDNKITLENLNTFNKRMTYLTNKYQYNEYETVGSWATRGKNSALAHANRSLIEIASKYGASTKEDFEKMFYSAVTNYQKPRLESIEKYSAYLGDSRYNQKKLKKWIKTWQEEAKYSRYTVQSSAENHFSDTVTHEFGHSLLFRSMRRNIEQGGKIFINNKEYYKLTEYQTVAYKTVSETLRKARSTGDIYKISKYANTDIHEFFAECFTIYEGGVEKLPDYINNMVKEVIKQ